MAIGGSGDGGTVRSDHQLAKVEPCLLEEEADEPCAVALKELAEEGRVSEAVHPPIARHGEAKEVFDVAHAGEDHEWGILW